MLGYLSWDIICSLKSKQISSAANIQAYVYFRTKKEAIIYLVTWEFAEPTLCNTYPNVHFGSTVRLSFKEFRRCIRRAAAPGLEMFSLLEYVTESKICENEETTVIEMIWEPQSWKNYHERDRLYHEKINYIFY